MSGKLTALKSLIALVHSNRTTITTTRALQCKDAQHQELNMDFYVLMEHTCSPRKAQTNHVVCLPSKTTGRGTKQRNTTSSSRDHMVFIRQSINLKCDMGHKRPSDHRKKIIVSKPHAISQQPIFNV